MVMRGGRFIKPVIFAAMRWLRRLISGFTMGRAHVLGREKETAVWVFYVAIALHNRIFGQLLI